jgi:hypothetical protein
VERPEVSVRNATALTAEAESRLAGVLRFMA